MRRRCYPFGRCRISEGRGEEDGSTRTHGEREPARRGDRPAATVLERGAEGGEEEGGGMFVEGSFRGSGGAFFTTSRLPATGDHDGEGGTGNPRDDRQCGGWTKWEEAAKKKGDGRTKGGANLVKVMEVFFFPSKNTHGRNCLVKTEQFPPRARSFQEGVNEPVRPLPGVLSVSCPRLFPPS